MTERLAAIRHRVRRSRAGLLADARAALEWSYANDHGADLRVPLAGSCARLFVELNLLNEARLWSQRALAMLDDTNRGSKWELELQSTLGHAFMFTERNSEQAESALKHGLEIADALGDHANKFRLLSRLNMFYRRTGDFRHLIPIALEAERVARLIGDTAGIAGSKASSACPIISSAIRPRRRPIWTRACATTRRCAGRSPVILPTRARRRFRWRGSCGCVAFLTVRRMRPPADRRCRAA